MTDSDREFEKQFPGKTALDVFPMDGRATECPRCQMKFGDLLHPFCTHRYCPPREYGNPNRLVEAAREMRASVSEHTKKIIWPLVGMTVVEKLKWLSDQYLKLKSQCAEDSRAMAIIHKAAKRLDELEHSDIVWNRLVARCAATRPADHDKVMRLVQVSKEDIAAALNGDSNESGA